MFASTVVALIGAGVAQADSAMFDFESYATGSINGQDGWSSAGPYDHQVAANTYGITSFGTKSLRLSNAVTSGSFGDQTFSRSLVDEAGETSAEGDGMSGGARQTSFEAVWSFASTVPTGEQPGLSFRRQPRAR